MKKTIAFLLFLLLQQLAWAQQTGRITGTVQSPDRKPLEAATVSLLKAQDSSLVKISISEADGKFELENLKPGNYLVAVNAMGHKIYQSSVVTLEASTPSLALPTIQLQADGGKVLQEVTVTSQKLFVEQKIDRTVVNVGALLSNAGTSALEVLEKSPGVLVGENGAISLKGKAGVVVFIDDKPTYLAGSDLENYLRSLPSETLEQIEIMTNPPAKYDAAGNAGVINIRTKKLTVKAFNGNLNLSYGRGKMGRTSNSLNLNYRNQKLNVFATFSQTAQNNFTDLNIERRYKTEGGQLESMFSQYSYLVRGFESYAGKLGLDFYATPATTLGIVVNGLLNPSDNSTDNTSRLLDAKGQLTSTLVADNVSRNEFQNGSVNLNLRHEFGKTGRSLGADVDFLAYRTDASQFYQNFLYQPGGELSSQDQLNGSLPAQIDIYTAKTDYSHPFQNGVKLELGAKASYIRTDNIADYLTTQNGITAPDYNLSNHFKYRENINAGYLNLNKDFKQWALQAGLRLENTVSKGNQLGNAEKKDSSFTRDYTHLFPTLYVQYKLDTTGAKSLTFSYGRRIERPVFQDLNPFLSPLDKLTYYAGNPFLLPTISHNLEVAYTHNLVTASASYSRSTDLINETIEIVKERENDGQLVNRYYSRPGNIGLGESFTVSLNATHNPAKWLRSTLYTELSHNRFDSKLYDTYLKTSGNFFYASLNNQITFKNGWSAEVSGLYRTDLIYTQFKIGGYWQANAGVQKRFLQEKATLRLNVADLFYTRITNGVINNLVNTEAWWRNAGDSRVVTLSFSYRFGKTAQNQPSRDTGGSESEQNRVRN
ncbi:outer membrane beta-barrel protein [Rufibacter sediminis]|uniref:TonB-dependent receptor n=1 Tax=Rufibacter sediminis TaxID=2762756 RepID=A0ABR6VW61_9BACT|nr:TonB-dependent receptor [Rufibacter sediminis]MBC3541427.1 TonB-dependent receptor [Rufibacter sediminis]